MMFLLLVWGLFQEAKAADMSVIDVRRNITLSENDTVYKDFYINAGPASGLKKNLVVTAVRKINIRDASGANAFGEIMVPVGQLKVIAIYDRIAVAREYSLLSRDELPMLEQIGIMTGDRIDLQGSFIDTTKIKKHKVAEAEEAKSTSTMTVTTTTPPGVPATAVSVAATSTSTVTDTPRTPAAKGATEKLLQESKVTSAPPLLASAPPSLAKSADMPPAVATKPSPASGSISDSASTSTSAPAKPETLEKVADSGNNSSHE